MHPDRNPNADQDKFKEYTAAYNLLSNEEKRKQYDEYRQYANYGSNNASSQGPGGSSYGPGANRYGQGFNPFGSGPNQNSGTGNDYKRYTYYSSPKSPEEARKEFEEFFKKASSQFGRGANFRGFDDFAKNFQQSYQKQKGKQYEIYFLCFRDEYFKQQKNSDPRGKKDPRQEFYEQYRQHGVPVILY